MSHQIITKPDHGVPIGTVEGKMVEISPTYQNFFDNLQDTLNRVLLGESLQLEEYTVATLPPADEHPGLIYVTDEAGGAVPAFNDGSAWRRVTDRAIVS